MRKVQPPFNAASRVVSAFVADGRVPLGRGAVSVGTAGHTRTIGPLGMMYAGSASGATRVANVSGFAATSALMLLVAYRTTAADSGARITNSAGGFRLLEIRPVSGSIAATARGSDSVSRTVVGPAVVYGDLVVAAATWEPGVGVSLSVNGIDYGTTAFAVALSHAPLVLQDAIEGGPAFALTAWLGRAWFGLRTELTLNPWQVFAKRRRRVPGSAAQSDALWLDPTGQLLTSASAGANRRCYLMSDGSVTASAGAVAGGRPMRRNAAGDLLA